jgi:hypothetical protein
MSARGPSCRTYSLAMVSHIALCYRPRRFVIHFRDAKRGWTFDSHIAYLTYSRCHGVAALQKEGWEARRERGFSTNKMCSISQRMPENFADGDPIRRSRKDWSMKANGHGDTLPNNANAKLDGSFCACRTSSKQEAHHPRYV